MYDVFREKQRGEYMARIPRNCMNTSFFHIMVQGNNKEFIFNSKKDIELYLEILQEVKEEIPISIISYCIMNNHAHFLFYIDEIDKMIKFMHKTSLKYAKYYNKKYDRVGYVFRGRYKTQEIKTISHFYNCIYYIHQNPVKANICEKAEEYPYSSLKNNCFKIDTEMERKIKIELERQGIWERSLSQPKKESNVIESNPKIYDEFLLLEVDEDKNRFCEEIIQQYCDYYKILKENLKEHENKDVLKNLIKKLRFEYKVSYRIMEKQLKIGRETLRKMI